MLADYRLPSEDPLSFSLYDRGLVLPVVLHGNPLMLLFLGFPGQGLYLFSTDYLYPSQLLEMENAVLLVALDQSDLLL